MPSKRTLQSLRPLFETKSGRTYHGLSEEVLRSAPVTNRRGQVQLVLTSPPFVLNRKKKYGNLQGQGYVDWLASFAPLLRDYLTEDGSIVIELGNAWEPGRPVMSTVALEALLEFKRRGELHLCQEFVYFNPARLPSPAQWVTVERCRVKDAFTRVWWLSPTEKPKADNRRILTQYSDSMRKLLKRGTYNTGKRPSQHGIGKSSFLTDHGGSIPPNVLIPAFESLVEQMLQDAATASTLIPISNTNSTDPYQLMCKEFGIEAHPARMPKLLVDFFVRFLSEEGDLVLDPFSGSNTTGAVSEGLGRKWMAVEANADYILGAVTRFSNSAGASAD